MAELITTTLLSDANLKAYYRVESGALTTDAGPNGVTLTNTNTVGEGTGKYGGAADFSAANTNKSLSAANTLGIDGGACSISLWVKLQAEIGSGEWTFAAQGNNTSQTWQSIRYNFNSGGGGARQLLISREQVGIAAANVTLDGNLGTSVYNHIVYSYDGVNVKGYFNGVLQGTTAGSGNGNTTLGQGVILGGRLDSAAGHFASVLLDDVAFFNRALLQADVTKLFAAGSTGSFLLHFL